MIASNKTNNKYDEWNRRWGAPYGYKYNFFLEYVRDFLKKITKKTNFKLFKILDLKISGIFALQPNSTTRTFEYPWAYYATPLKKGMNVIDIGGGLSGFQFVLSKAGLNVINVDPSDKEFEWVYQDDFFDLLNDSFGTNVKLVPKYLNEANLDSGKFDRIFCISVLEHLTQNEQKIILTESYRLLKKGGFFIITLDLFLDIYPFSDVKRNKWGSNMNAAKFIEDSGFKLIQGNKKELLGFSEFKVNNIMKDLSQYYIGKTYPVLTQTLVLQKN